MYKDTHFFKYILELFHFSEKKFSTGGTSPSPDGQRTPTRTAKKLSFNEKKSFPDGERLFLRPTAFFFDGERRFFRRRIERIERKLRRSITGELLELLLPQVNYRRITRIFAAAGRPSTRKDNCLEEALLSITPHGSVV